MEQLIGKDLLSQEIYPKLTVKDLRNLSVADKKLKIDLSQIDQMLDEISAQGIQDYYIDHFGDSITAKYWKLSEKLTQKYRLSMLPKNLEKKALLHGFALMMGDEEFADIEEKDILQIRSVLESADKRAEREALETIFRRDQIKEIYDMVLDDIREWEIYKLDLNRN